MSIGKENEKLEFKKTTSELKEAIKSISAILNKHGEGELYFGISNDGIPLGQDISEKTLRDISQTIFNGIDPKVYPKITEVILEGKHCINVKFSGNETPYLANGRAYIRVADEDKVMSSSEIRSYIKKEVERNYFWDSENSDESPDIIDNSKLEKYIQKANQVDRIDFTFSNKLNVLERLKLISNGN